MAEPTMEFLDDDNMRETIFGTSKSGNWTVDDLRRDLVADKFTYYNWYDEGRYEQNLDGVSDMYAYDYLKHMIKTRAQGGPSTSGSKKYEIDYWLYMKVCWEEARRWDISAGSWRKWTYQISILHKYDDDGIDDWVIFFPQWHLNWQMNMLKDLIIPDMIRWQSAGMPFSWDPRAQPETPSDGSLDYYNATPDEGTSAGSIIFTFLRFWKTIINRTGWNPHKLGTGYGTDEWIGFWAPKCWHVSRNDDKGSWDGIAIDSDGLGTGGAWHHFKKDTAKGLSAYPLIGEAFVDHGSSLMSSWPNFIHGTSAEGQNKGELWKMYLRALSASKVAADLNVIDKDRFVTMCFDFAKEAKQKIEFIDKPEMSVIFASGDEYKFPMIYETQGANRNMTTMLAHFYSQNQKNPLSNTTNKGTNMLLMGPHLSPYSTKAKRWNWEILNAKNWINSNAGGTFLAEVYNDLDRLIHAKVTQEDEKTARAKIELPSGEVVRIDKKIPGFGTANLFKKKIPENSYLASIGVSVSDIPAMLANFQAKQPEQYESINAPRKLIDALTAQGANAKVDEHWSRFFHNMYLHEYTQMMIAGWYYRKGKFTPGHWQMNEASIAKGLGGLRVPYYGQLRRMGWEPQQYKIAGINSDEELGQFIESHWTANKLGTLYARDIGIALMAFIGSVWMNSWYTQINAKALMKGGKIGLTENDLGDAESKALGDTLADPNLDLAEELMETGGLDAKQIAKRFDTFYKQCALLGNMGELASQHNKYIVARVNGKKDEFHKNGFPYNGRFWLIQDGTNVVAKETKNEEDKIAMQQSMDQNGLSTKVLVPRSLKGFESLNPAALTMLTPLLRLYLVVKKDGVEKQIEMVFPQGGLGSGGTGTPYERLSKMMDSKFDRGNGAGVKDLVLSFEGTNPAAARNDIKAELNLFFATFADFFREREGPDGKYSFSDLVVYPSYKGRADGRGEQEGKQYNPSNYKVRLDVGYQPIDRATQAAISAATGIPDSGAHVADEISKTNKSYYLNRVGEDISLNEDGSVNIKIEFRAYVESLMKMNELDALTSPAVLEMKNKRQAKLDEAQKKGCTEQEMKKILEALTEADEMLGATARRSIMTRLIDSGKIYSVDIDLVSKHEFETNGFFVNKPRMNSVVKTAAGETKDNIDGKKAAKKQKKTVDLRGNPDFLFLKADSKGEGGEFIDENIGQNTRINFFYIGDLVHILLDSMYHDDPNLNQKYERKRVKMLLGGINYYDFDGSLRVCNVANIPVAAEYFYEWMTEHIVKKKLLAYPIINFIRDLCNNLISDILGSICQNANQESRISFYTMPLYTKPKESLDPFQYAYERQGKNGGSAIRSFINAQLEYSGKDSDILPLQTETSIADANKMLSYMFIYSYITPHLSPPGRGNRQEDLDRGVHHFYIGAPTGLVKKMTFNKSDIAFLRESRFMAQGDLGIAQLGAVYNVTVDMIGNTIYYPGMELYIDPLGIGGTEFGDPGAGGQWNKGKTKFSGRSIANAMGFGGYHSVIKVQSRIGAGKFQTTLTVQWVHSGDGRRGVRVGKPPPKRGEKYQAKGGTQGVLSHQCQQIQDELLDEADSLRLDPKKRQEKLKKKAEEAEAKAKAEEQKEKDAAEAQATAASTSKYLEEAAAETNKKPD